MARRLIARSRVARGRRPGARARRSPTRTSRSSTRRRRKVDPTYATTLRVSGSGFQSVKGGHGGIYVFFGTVTAGWQPSRGGATGKDYFYVPDSEAKNNQGFQKYVAFPGSDTASSANGGTMTRLRLLVDDARRAGRDVPGLRPGRQRAHHRLPQGHLRRDHRRRARRRQRAQRDLHPGHASATTGQAAADRGRRRRPRPPTRPTARRLRGAAEPGDADAPRGPADPRGGPRLGGRRQRAGVHRDRAAARRAGLGGLRRRRRRRRPVPGRRRRHRSPASSRCLPRPVPAPTSCGCSASTTRRRCSSPSGRRAPAADDVAPSSADDDDELAPPGCSPAPPALVLLVALVRLGSGCRRRPSCGADRVAAAAR